MDELDVDLGLEKTDTSEIGTLQSELLQEESQEPDDRSREGISGNEDMGARTSGNAPSRTQTPRATSVVFSSQLTEFEPEQSCGLGSGPSSKTVTPSSSTRVSIAGMVGAKVTLSRRASKCRSKQQFFQDDDDEEVELPADFQILPVYKEILELPLPAMDIYPLYRPEGGDILEVVKRIDWRIRNNPTYKQFLLETQELLVYCLQEIRARVLIQKQVRAREDEIHALTEKQKRDPRINRLMLLADHWRKQKHVSDERTTQLTNEVNTLMAESRVMEIRINAMQKRQDKMELQINKSKGCEHEKERLEELVMSRDKTIVEAQHSIDLAKNALNTAIAEAATKEEEFKTKLEAVPDRYAQQLARLARELENMNHEKDLKQRRLSELTSELNLLSIQYMHSNQRVKMLMRSIRDTWAVQRQYETCQAHYAAAEAKVRACLRKISSLEEEARAMKAKFTEQVLDNKILQHDANEAHKDVVMMEQQNAHLLRRKHSEAQRANELQNQLISGSKHIQVALGNVHRMGDEIDKYNASLKALQAEIYKCGAEHNRDKSTIQHLHKLLESSENMVRLRTLDNDSLIISKAKMVDMLRSCTNTNQQLNNNVTKLYRTKLYLDDVVHTQKYMLDYVESERDGAIRKAKQADDNFVIMQRQQVAKLAQIAQLNSETSKLKMKVEEVQHLLNVQKKDLVSLTLQLRQAETTEQQLESYNKQIMRQRDMFGSQLLQMKNESEMNFIKMTTIMRVLDRAKTSYWDKCQDVRVLIKEIMNLKRKLVAFDPTDTLNQELKLEVARLSKELALEQNKRAAIERLKAPRIHRFRDIESCHPSMYELILKMQRYQRILIRKTQDSISQETELAIKTDHIRQLKLAVARREKADKRTASAKDKERKIKALTAEVNMLNYYKDVNRQANEEQRQELMTAKQKLNQLRRVQSAKPVVECCECSGKRKKCGKDARSQSETSPFVQQEHAQPKCKTSSRRAKGETGRKTQQQEFQESEDTEQSSPAPGEVEECISRFEPRVSSSKRRESMGLGLGGFPAMETLSEEAGIPTEAAEQQSLEEAGIPTEAAEQQSLEQQNLRTELLQKQYSGYSTPQEHFGISAHELQLTRERSRIAEANSDQPSRTHSVDAHSRRLQSSGKELSGEQSSDAQLSRKISGELQLSRAQSRDAQLLSRTHSSDPQLSRTLSRDSPFSLPQSRDPPLPLAQSRDSLLPHTQSRDALLSRIRSRDEQLSRTQSQDAQLPRTRSRDEQLSRTQSQDAQLPRTRSRDEQLSRTQSQDAQLPRTRSRDEQLSRTQSQDAQLPRTRSRDEQLSRTQSQDAQLPRTRSRDEQLSRTQSQDAQLPRTQSRESSSGHLGQKSSSKLLIKTSQQEMATVASSPHIQTRSSLQDTSQKSRPSSLKSRGPSAHSRSDLLSQTTAPTPKSSRGHISPIQTPTAQYSSATRMAQVAPSRSDQTVQSPGRDPTTQSSTSQYNSATRLSQLSPTRSGQATPRSLQSQLSVTKSFEGPEVLQLSRGQSPHSPEFSQAELRQTTRSRSNTQTRPSENGQSESRSKTETRK